MSNNRKSKIVIEDPYASEFSIQRPSPSLPSLNFEQNVLLDKTQIDVEIRSNNENLIASTFAEMTYSNPGDESAISVVLDCANIGWSYGHTKFSVYGVKIAIEYFERIGIKAIGFIPQSYLQRKPAINDMNRTNQLMETEEMELLQQYIWNNKISLVPSGMK